MLKRLFAAVSLVLLSHVMFDAAQANPLVFATEANYAPFVYQDEQGQATGFDIELIQALCQQMQANCKIQQRPWDNLIGDLKRGQVQGIIGAFSITEERKKQIIFSDPIYMNQTSFILPQKSLPVTLDKLLKEKQVGVQDNTIYDHYLTKAGAKKIRFNRYGNIEEALYDLTTGRIEAALGDREVFKLWLKQKIQDQRLQYQLLDIALDLDEQGYAIGIQKNNPELQLALNKALKQVRHNGTYQQLLEKYNLVQ